MTTFEKGLRQLPSQIKRDIKALEKGVTSKKGKKKTRKLTSLLGKIEKEIVG